MWVYEGPRVGSVQYDFHEHTDKAGGWLATAVTFRLAADPRDSPVHLDAFLARTNGTHAWTDSAVLPLAALLPSRRLRFFDWLAPGPCDPQAALELWYGPRFAMRRKCPLRRPTPRQQATSAAAVGAGVEQIAEVPGGAVAKSYPSVRNEWVGGIGGGILRSTVHRNGTVLWLLTLNATAGEVIGEPGGPPSPAAASAVGALTGPGVRLVRLGKGPRLGAVAVARSEHHHQGSFPAEVPNMWD